MGSVSSKGAKVVTNTLGNSHSNPQTNQTGGTLNKRLGKLKSSTTRKMKNKNNEKDDKDQNDGGTIAVYFHIGYFIYYLIECKQGKAFNPLTVRDNRKLGDSQTVS